MQQHHPGFLIHDTVRLFRLCFGARIQDLALSEAQWRALGTVGKFEGISQTELADYLARKDMPFREAHKIVSDIVHELRHDDDGKENLEDFSLEELQSFSPLFQKDVYKYLSLPHVTAKRNSRGGTGTKALSRQIKKLKSLLKK